MHELFKNKGLSSDIGNWRDVFLGDYTGKAAFKVTRRALVPLASSLVGQSQHGSGLNGGETAFPHLNVRLFFELAATRKQTAGGIFVDVASAFAKILRRIIFDTEQGDEKWLGQLRDTGFSPQEIEAMISFVKCIQESYNDVSSPIPPPPQPSPSPAPHPSPLIKTTKNKRAHTRTRASYRDPERGGPKY